MGLPEALRGITDLKSVRSRVQAWYMMSLRPLAEAKNTVEHNIAAQERAHSVHMKIILPVRPPAAPTWASRAATLKRRRGQ